MQKGKKKTFLYNPNKSTEEIIALKKRKKTLQNVERNGDSEKPKNIGKV